MVNGTVLTFHHSRGHYILLPWEVKSANAAAMLQAERVTDIPLL